DMMVQVVVAVAHDDTDYRSYNRYLFSVAQNKLQKGNVFNIEAGKQALRNINTLSLFLNIDLEVALKGSLETKFRNTGQTCVCANRLLVQEGIYMFLEGVHICF
nr:succinate-semialdehyde dehydrogenase, mitochondrial isoform X1 [Tanacetum cinerariifolium]